MSSTENRGWVWGMNAAETEWRSPTGGAIVGQRDGVVNRYVLVALGSSAGHPVCGAPSERVKGLTVTLRRLHWRQPVLLLRALAGAALRVIERAAGMMQAGVRGGASEDERERVRSAWSEGILQVEGFGADVGAQARGQRQRCGGVCGSHRSRRLRRHWLLAPLPNAVGNNMDLMLPARASRGDNGTVQRQMRLIDRPS